MRTGRVFGFLSLMGAALWWVLWESSKHWFLEKLVDFAEKKAISWAEPLIHFGPPAVLAGLGLYLLLRGESAEFKGPPESNDAPIKNLSRWTDQDSYFVWVAAYLWAELEPAEGKLGPKSKGYATLQMIKGAIDTGKIRSIAGGASMKDRVSKEELKKLAFAREEFPKFLFPG